MAALAQVSIKEQKLPPSRISAAHAPWQISVQTRPQPQGPFSYQSESSSVLPETTCHAAEQAHTYRDGAP